nr:cytochrome p450 76a2 [Quercus suber]
MRGNMSLMPRSVDALRDLSGTHQGDFEKPSGGRRFLARVLDCGLILSEGSVHTRQMKQLTSSIRIQNIRSLHDLVFAKTEILLAKMEDDCRDRASQGVEIRSWASKVRILRMNGMFNYRDLISEWTRCQLSLVLDMELLRHQPLGSLKFKENKKYQVLLRDEIIARPETIKSPMILESLPWLNAIIEETSRVFPPVTSTAREAVRDTTLAGTTVPGGTMVLIFPWAINRHPRCWGGTDA